MSTDASGQVISQARYTPFGEAAWEDGQAQTDFGFTGQRAERGMGLMDYKARFYAPVLGRFVSADTVVPPGVQGWDRYAGMLNNPVRYVDPSGHLSCSHANAAEGDCTDLSFMDAIKWTILDTFGVTLSDEGDKIWDAANARLVLLSLYNIDNALGGQLKALVGEATFKLGDYVETPENCPDGGCTFSGWTSERTVTFYTTGSDAIRQQNIYHEFGHVLDNIPEIKDVFSNALAKLTNPSFITNDDYLNRKALVEEYWLTTDPNYDYVKAVQHPSTDPVEQWADIFANYVAGNINLDKSQGQDMYNWITGVLAPYLGP
jgi:RHS repeat-associated protein